MAVDYLVWSTEDSGKFVYEFDPIRNASVTGYNILRHSGTIYALLEAYAMDGDPDALAAAERAIAYLQSTTIPCPNNANATCVAEAGEIKLGGNALAILALAEHARVTGKDAHIATAKALAAYILDMQSPEGEFTAHKITDGGTLTPFTSEYYPGEALFALARLGKVTGEKEYLDSAHQGAHWIITVRDGEKLADDLPHDHWLLYALNELYADRPDALYLDHARKLTDVIIRNQHRDLTGQWELWSGGYYSPPRSTPTATRSEGLLAAYHLFIRAGDNVYAERAKDGARRGIEFQLRTQITPQIIRREALASSALGGFGESLEDRTIRVDYVQHNLSSILAYRNLP